MPKQKVNSQFYWVKEVGSGNGSGYSRRSDPDPGFFSRKVGSGFGSNPPGSETLLYFDFPVALYTAQTRRGNYRDRRDLNIYKPLSISIVYYLLTRKLRGRILI